MSPNGYLAARRFGVFFGPWGPVKGGVRRYLMFEKCRCASAVSSRSMNCRSRCGKTRDLRSDRSQRRREDDAVQRRLAHLPAELRRRSVRLRRISSRSTPMRLPAMVLPAPSRTWRLFPRLTVLENVMVGAHSRCRVNFVTGPVPNRRPRRGAPSHAGCDEHPVVPRPCGPRPSTGRRVCRSVR